MKKQKKLTKNSRKKKTESLQENPEEIKQEEINEKKEKIEKENLSGLKLAKKFYEEVGAKMIHEKFPEYEDKIAVGFVGEGSERFGFDDRYSIDHDFGPGFCMWVTKTVYSEIGEQLQEEYDKLPTTYRGNY